MKQCIQCNEIKPLSEFKPQRNGKPRPRCFECQQKNSKIYWKSWYGIEKNRQANIRRSTDHGNKKRKANQQKVLEYFKDHPCIDCKEADPVVLEFDHIYGQKDFEISWYLTRRKNWDVILEEIKKCEVRCCNCHRKRHAKEQGWYKNDF